MDPFVQGQTYSDTGITEVIVTKYAILKDQVNQIVVAGYKTRASSTRVKFACREAICLQVSDVCERRCENLPTYARHYHPSFELI